MEEVKKQGVESLFVPYELALELKELGFNENSLAWFLPEIASKDNIPSPVLGSYSRNFNSYPDRINAPLWQQAFDWFREKYDLLGYVNDESSIEDNPNLHKKWIYVIQELPVVLHDDLSNDKVYKTYKEAELECLKKLIEIVKEQNVK